MNKSIIKYLGYFSVLLILCLGCDSQITSENESALDSAIDSEPTVFQAEVDADIKKRLTKVRSATAHYHDVEKAEADGYIQTSPFVPGMGYHYVNPSLVDSEVIPTEPEALVYQGNPVHEDKRKLGAVEYLIPAESVESQSDLDGKFPGVDGDKWHLEEEIDAWTLHAWVWYPNPEGVFHSHNPRVGSGQ